MTVREVVVVGLAAVTGSIVTILLLPSMGLAGDPGPPYTGGLVLGLAAAVLLVIRRRRSAGRDR